MNNDVKNTRRLTLWSKEKVNEKISSKVKELVLSGNCVSYNEVLENSDSILFRDEENILIYVDDQYCMNPKCLCNETFLSFVQINEKDSKSELIFTIRYKLKNGQYEVEFKACTEERMKDLIKTFKEEEKQVQEELKQRYRTMKGVGEKVYAENKVAKVTESTVSKISRNDDCPCGSGKKYKKCCGK
jgi:uncharacterized protein YchJ